MTPSDNLIIGILAAAEGEIVGRVRLQKVFYLLDQVGMASGLAFHYHYYGPYSGQLDDALNRAQAIQGVREAIRYRQFDGMPYSIFSLPGDQKAQAPYNLGGIPFDNARRLIRTMKGTSSTVLELAATIHWLVHNEKCGDWKKELILRKGVKAKPERIDQAVSLLKEIGLSPP